MLWDTVLHSIRYHHGCDRSQALHHFSCFVEPPHMGVRGYQKSTDHHVGWPIMMRHEEVFDGVIKLPIEKMGLADSG